MLQDPRKFQYSSDYTAPVYIQKYEVSMTISPYDQDGVTITHDLGFTPRVVGEWSFYSDFRVSYGLSYTETNDGLYRQYTVANGTTITPYILNDSDNAVTVWFRLYALSPSDYMGYMPSITDSTNYVLNSDYDYPKMVQSGLATVGSSGEVVVRHNLGYRPVVRCWVKDSYSNDYEIMHGASIYPDSGFMDSYGMFIDAEKITWTGLSSGDTVDYQIFGEEI